MSTYRRAQLASLLSNIGLVAVGPLSDYLLRVAGKAGVAEPVALAATIVALYLRSLVTRAHVTAPAASPN